MNSDFFNLTDEERIQLIGDLKDSEEFRDDEPEYFQYLEAPKILEESKKHKGRSTGFETLDKIIDGVCSGELIVITSPTGVGKTTLCQSISWKLAARGHPCLWYTLEVSLENLLQAFIRNDTEVKRTPTGELIQVSNNPIYFPKNIERIDFKILKRVIKYANIKYGVEHVFIDHLHYLLDSKDLQKTKSTSLFIGDKLRQLRQIAHETGVSIFLVAHLSKLPDNQKPTLADMRDSSFIGQEADVVIVLWRERLKEPKSKLLDGIEILETYSPIVHCMVDKARRTGQKGIVYLEWINGLYYEIDLNRKKELEQPEQFIQQSERIVPPPI